MSVPLEIFDDFAPDVRKVREAVIEEGFATEIGPDGAEYTGISKCAVPHWHTRISELLGVSIQPRISCFRLNLKGELPHSWVHSDDICAQWASVLYLNLPSQCRGGTAFWRHATLNMDRLFTPVELKACGLNATTFYPFMTEQWKDKAAWRQYDFVPMRFGRFVTYPTCYFHSRWPWEGFGEGPENGRLIWVCFYDREEK